MNHYNIPGRPAPGVVGGLMPWPAARWDDFDRAFPPARVHAIMDVIHVAMRRVPPKAVDFFTSALKSGFDRFNTRGGRGDEAFKYIQLLPAFLLSPVPGRADLAGPVVRRRCEALSRGAWDDLLEDALYNILPHDARAAAAPDRTPVDRAKRLMSVGQVSRATSQLESTGLAPSTRATFVKLEALHPQPPLPAAAAIPDPPAFDLPELSMNKITIKLRKLKPLVGSDRSNLHNEHLKLIKSDPAALDSFRTFLLHLSRGDMSDYTSASLASARLIGILKNPDVAPEDSAVRPVAVPNSIRKFVAGLIIGEARTDLDAYYRGVQYGTVESGSEMMTHRTQLLLELDPAKVIITADLKNAFNEVSRLEGLKQLKDISPSALPFFRRLYTSAASLHFRTDDGTLSIASREGGQQGDPGAGDLFCLAIHPVLLQVGREFPDVDTYSFFDDGNIVGRQSLGGHYFI